MLQEQIFQLQNQNLMLCKQMGKCLRAINTEKPIKLNFTGLLQKSAIDFVLSGMKENICVTELDLSQNALGDDELLKICDRLIGDEKIEKLKLS